MLEQLDGLLRQRRLRLGSLRAALLHVRYVVPDRGGAPPLVVRAESAWVLHFLARVAAETVARHGHQAFTRVRVPSRERVPHLRAARPECFIGGDEPHDVGLVRYEPVVWRGGGPLGEADVPGCCARDGLGSRCADEAARDKQELSEIHALLLQPIQITGLFPSERQRAHGPHTHGPRPGVYDRNLPWPKGHMGLTDSPRGSGRRSRFWSFPVLSCKFRMSI
mmetsp:Transcript_20693/g.43485  ORF Transcript_20693/g.43485 Transcript_20693/m.43485 type:complete len:222 (+) Transcript_20693:1032-1697(+)